MSDLEAAVRDYIVKSYLNGQAASFRNDDDLLMVLDSLQILRMLIDLEGQYSIKVENSELTPDNFGTVERLAAFIARKRQAAVC
jgi:acyl carrier protein